MLLILQTLGELKDIITIKDISIIGIFMVIIYVLWKENQELKAKVEKVIQDHQDDLKEEIKTVQAIMAKYNQFTQDVKAIINYEQNRSK